VVNRMVNIEVVFTSVLLTFSGLIHSIF